LHWTMLRIARRKSTSPRRGEVKTEDDALASNRILTDG
jgi:hypothetical protein